MTRQLTRQTIGVGVAGTGFIGPVHTEGLRRNGIQVLGILGNTKEIAEQKAVELGIPRVYDSLDEMLANPGINVVHLATPNHLHHVQAKASLLAGKHVVCEKPLAMNAKESAELVKLAAEKKLVNALNFNIRMYALVQQARSIVQKGELGEFFVMQGSYLQDGLLFPTDWNWRLERKVVSYPGGHNEGFPDTFKQLYAKIYNYILAGDYTKIPDFPTFADGHHEMQLCEAIERSAREKVWVKVR